MSTNSPAPSLKFPDHWKVFPKHDGASEAIEQPVSMPAAATRILIAEDDTVSCKILASRLQQWGYAPVITRDGHEAMAVMRQPDAPSLVVLDWMMPGMDGLEVCRRLREIDKVTYIIFLTALGAKEKIVEALDAGADDYLAKPFDHLELQARIHVGLRIINLQNALRARVEQWERMFGRGSQGQREDSLPI